MAKRRFGPSTKMAPTAELSLTQDPMGNSHKNILLRNHWANLNQTLLNDPWMVPFQNCVRHFRPPTKMAATAELNLI
jgi:hypothetical protein